VSFSWVYCNGLGGPLRKTAASRPDLATSCAQTALFCTDAPSACVFSTPKRVGKFSYPVAIVAMHSECPPYPRALASGQSKDRQLRAGNARPFAPLTRPPPRLGAGPPSAQTSSLQLHWNVAGRSAPLCAHTFALQPLGARVERAHIAHIMRQPYKSAPSVEQRDMCQ